MPDEQRSKGITTHERAERRHNAEVTRHAPVTMPRESNLPDVGTVPARIAYSTLTRPAPVTMAHQRRLPDDATLQDRIAYATGAMGPDTVTDPVKLMMEDDRAGQGGGRNR